MQFASSALAVTILVATVSAQPVGLTPTFTGFLHDSAARTLRAVVGVPGSAYVGDAVAEDVDAAWAAPANNAAIIIRGDKTVLLTGLNAAAVHETGEHLLPKPAKVSWSSAGNAAALYSAEGNLLQRITIQAGEVQVHSPETISFLGALHAIAINRKGDIVAAAEEGLFLLRNGSSPQLLISIAASSLSFFSDDRLYVSTADSVLQVRLSDQSVQQIVAGVPISVLSTSVKLAGILAMDAANRKIYVFNLDGSMRHEISVDRTPSALTPLQNDSVFVLNGFEENGLPINVLNAAPDVGLFFVPVGTSKVL
jgi:hypothetical protein